MHHKTQPMNRAPQKPERPALLSQVPGARVAGDETLERNTPTDGPCRQARIHRGFSGALFSASCVKFIGRRRVAPITRSRNYVQSARRSAGGARHSGAHVGRVGGHAATRRQPRRASEANAVRIPFRALAVSRRSQFFQSSPVPRISGTRRRGMPLCPGDGSL